MASYDCGKKEVCEWIRETIDEDGTILDVGACDGKWRRLLPEYPNMDAIEIYEDNALEVYEMYRQMYIGDIADYEYEYYDLVIFGDVIEHMTTAKARRVLDYAKTHGGYVLIAVPYEYEQGAIYGNPYEEHLQPDLTPEIFEERYPGYDVLLRAAEDYCYYTARGTPTGTPAGLDDNAKKSETKTKK